MTRTLRPYQDLMIDHVLAHKKCAIWAFMGAGKTVSILTAIDRLLLGGAETKTVLIVAPLRVARDVWPTEAAEWPHLKDLKVVPILGTPTQRLDALRNRADVHTINFENLEWLIETWGDHWPYGMIVIDESTKLKSLRASIRSNNEGKTWVQGQGGVRAKALLKATFRFKTERFVELSGTPAPAGLQDLWGQLFFLDHGQRLGRVFDGFKRRWFRASYDGFGIEPLPHAQVQIETEVKDICMSLKSEDWFNLEEPIVRTVRIDLPQEARKQYREMEKRLFTEIQTHPIEAFSAGSKTAKLRQLVAGAVYTGSADDPGERKWVSVHDEKIKALEEIVEEASGAPVLVAYHFKSDLVRLLRHFPKGRVLDQKSSTIDEFNAGGIPILFAHPSSAGHGLNLQRGSNILVYFSCDFNAESHWQIAERIGPVRQAQSGLKRSVFIYYIVGKNTIDEDVLSNLQSKVSINDSVMNGMRRRISNGI